MKTTTETASPSPELQAVLDNQKALADANASAEQLRGLIAQQQDKATTLGAQASELKALETQREDLLADIATGQNKARELAALDAQLARQRESLTAQDTQAAVEQTASGLARKLARVEAAAAELQAQRSNLLRALLFARAEVLGAEYKAVALQLRASYHQLEAHCNLLSLGGAPDLQIPSFPMRTTQPDRGAMNTNFVVDTSYGGREARALGGDELKAALRSLGVEID